MGETSSAAIDAEVSSVSMMVARSFGVRTVIAGCAKASTPTARAVSSAAQGKKRCHPERLGTIDASRSTLLKRAAT